MTEQRTAARAGLVEALGLHPGEIVGKTVLNVGSAAGDLCLAALELGAARSVGIDPSGARVQTARRAAAAAGLNAEFVDEDFENWNGGGAGFDVVVCSNVLHRMLDPIHALRRMMQLTHDKLVVEFSVPSFRDVRKYHLSPVALLGGGSGLIAPAYARYNSDVYNRTFLFTPDAIRTVLNQHNITFEPVSIRRSEHAGRYVATTGKRQIEHLTVIAGPTSSGKGTLYRQLSPELRSQLGIPQRDSVYIEASQVQTLPAGKHAHAVLHYDLLRPFGGGLHRYERDIVTELFAVAKRVTFITLFTDIDRLRKQITESEVDSRRPSKRSPRHLRLLELYADPQFLTDWYQRWACFCQRFAGKTAGSFFVENRDHFEVRPASNDGTALLPGVSADRPDAERVTRG